jgi:hypothetical protein
MSDWSDYWITCNYEKVDLNRIMAKMAFQGEISAENAFFALFRPKIRTWQTMPLKVGIIATFRGLLSD